jgi:hypothetical protein
MISWTNRCALGDGERDFILLDDAPELVLDVLLQLRILQRAESVIRLPIRS